MEYSFTAPSAVEFADLYEHTGWGSWTIEAFDRALAGSWIVCTARDEDGTLLGIGRLISDGALHAFVTEMIVAPTARDRGVGGIILSELVGESRRRGVADVQLFAARGRVEFYERNGFIRRPTHAPGMDLARIRD